jgi:hypothetical protein
MNPPKKLTNLQLELLRVFSYDLPEGQLLEIRQLLAKYFAQKIDEEMDALWEEKGWNEDTMRAWANEHLRTPYRAVQTSPMHPA